MIKYELEVKANIRIQKFQFSIRIWTIVKYVKEEN